MSTKIDLQLDGNETGVLLAALRAIIEDGMVNGLDDPELNAAMELDRKISVALGIEPLDVGKNEN